MQLLICPVEVIVKLEQHENRSGSKYRFFSLVIGAALSDERREQDLYLRSDTEIHDKTQVCELVCIEFAYSVVHLVLLRLRRLKLLSFEITFFVALLQVLVQELVDHC